jgi:formylglycine-generating enzyme required for sulfatase activity
LQSSAQIVVEKTEDAGTIIDEDFDKTKKLEVEPTQDWRAIEAEKERQRQLAEAQRRQAEEEAKRIAALEAQRRQAELEEIQRKLAQNSNQSSSNLWKWAVGGLSGFVVLLLGIIGINSLSNNNSTVGNATNRPANSASNKPAAKTSTTPAFKNSIGMEFVLIPSGTFMMGSPTSEKDRDDDETQHQVTISKSFYLGKYEVTQAEWEKVMGSNPSYFKGCPRCPVENVSWEDVQDFIRKLNTKGEGRYRLPTEAEWEYAARAGSTARYSYGDGEGSLGNYAWYSANSGSKTHEVGTKQPNEWGLYDMHGNVWEWCGDWYGAYSSSAQIDPTGATSGSYRVIRGGSWNYVAVNLRSANRYSNSPSFRSYNLGFRVVRE